MVQSLVKLMLKIFEFDVLLFDCLWTPAQRKRASMLYFANVFFYHSLNGSSDSVNGDLQFYGDRQISIPHKIDTPEQIDKKLGTVYYVHETTPYTKFGTNIHTEGFLANG